MSSSSDQRGPVELLAEEFLARCKRGEKPTIKEYCDRHPGLADEIRDVFEAVLMVEDLKPGSSDVSGSLGESVNVNGKRLEQVGDYRILCEIGRGGMGVVYEAEQQALGRRVALKVLPRTIAGDGSAQVRFQREAKAAARMHHTNIVPVFDVGSDGEHLYYAMQLIHGQGLDLVIQDLRRLRAQSTAPSAVADDRAAERSIAASLVAGQFHRENLALEGEADSKVTAAYEGSLPSSAVLPGQSDISTATSNRGAYFRSVAQIGVQTASALSYAHGRGIIHRDIKPGNLILDTTGNVWVTDFGLAKTGDGGITHTGDILGTVRYMSPERFRGQCDVRADVYALGMTLYELLTLKAAYASGDRLKLIDLIRHADAASPRSIDARIPRDLETIVMKAIDKDPKRRYQSADEMGEDLQRFVNDEPIKARRVGQVERFARWCRHHPAVAGLIATVLAVMAVGTTLSLWQARRATQERDRAEVAEQRAKAEKDNAQAALDFLWDDLLSQASPGAQPDPDIKLRTALDQAVKQLEHRRNLPPLIEASIRQMVGRIYHDLGDYKKSVENLRLAVKAQREGVGEEDPRTLTTMHFLASALMYGGTPTKEGLSLLERTLELRTKVLGEEHIDTCTTMRRLQRRYAVMHRFDEAERLARKELATQLKLRGENHRETMEAMSTMVETLGHCGQFREAEELATAALERSRRAFGEDITTTWRARRYLILVLTQQKKWAEAAPWCEQAVQSSRKVYGDGHWFTLHEEYVLAEVYLGLGRVEEASKLIDTILPRLKSMRGEASFPVFLALYVQGQIRLRQQRPADAERAFRKGLTIAEKIAEKGGEIKIDGSSQRVYLGISLARQKRYDEAAPLIIEGYRSLTTREVQSRRWVRDAQLAALEELVQLYKVLGKADEAAMWKKELDRFKVRAK